MNNQQKEAIKALAEAREKMELAGELLLDFGDSEISDHGVEMIGACGYVTTWIEGIKGMKGEGK